MLTSSTQLQNRSFHVVERTRTSTKCQKMKNACAKRAKILFFIVNYANLWVFCCRRRRVCLRTFALIVCAEPFCAGNATVICHASLRLTGPEDKHGVQNAGGKISGRVYSFGSSVTPIFIIMNHSLYLLSTKYDKMKKISP